MAPLILLQNAVKIFRNRATGLCWEFGRSPISGMAGKFRYITYMISIFFCLTNPVISNITESLFARSRDLAHEQPEHSEQAELPNRVA